MLNPKEEAKFKELKDKCRELKVPAPPEIFIGLQVHENGVLVFDDRQRGHSWNRNLYNFLYLTSTYSNGAGSYAAAGQGMKAVSGTTYASLSSAQPFAGANGAVHAAYGFYNNAASATFGILVGTGDTAFSADQYTLATAIAHGSGSGQMSFVGMAAPTVGYTAGTKTWKTTWVRIFNNNSGGSITVKETGMSALYSALGNPWVSPFLMERSVLSPTVAVANGAQLTVTYEISMDFSAID